ncbi:DUF5518 domain-containing protein [Halorubrum trueperi]|uniref:DUF5518 domain-containing protein n=1 Tax=Halorubrum trueperi TaxID=2004704 RepID=A0ABD5UKW7_9EURY
MVPDESPSDTAEAGAADDAPNRPDDAPNQPDDVPNRPDDAPDRPHGDTSDRLLAPGDDSPADLGDVLLYGVLGGVAGSVLSFVPFATVLGGALAGYLCGGRPADGLKTGAVAGAVMTLPFVAVVGFLLFFLGLAGAPAEFGILALLVIGLAAAYTFGSGVVGGYLGHYLRGKL